MKYGKPSASEGELAVGEVKFTWRRPDGFRLVVRRGWPSTQSYLDIYDPTVSGLLEKELAVDSARQIRQAAERPMDSF